MRMPDLKSLFETPQKARLTMICLVAALATLGAITAYIIYALQGPGADVPPSQTESVSGAPSEPDGPSQSVTPPEPSTQVGLVPSLTIGEARELALADAGTAASEADVTREALAEDNGIWVYEFRFRTDSAQYEYKLNANTGEIRTKVKETFIYPTPEAAQPSMPSLPAESAPPAETAPQPSIPPQPAQSSVPDGNSPAAPSAAPSQSTSMYIGMDRAKAIALGHAGLSASQVRFTHTRMDREDGRMVYEIEFYEGRVEYEYEIDAATGRILDYERDAD